MTMLDRMRRHKSWLKWSLALVVLTFIAFYIPQFMEQTPAPVGGVSPRAVIAEVGDYKVRAGEFTQLYARRVQSIRQQFGNNVNETMLRQFGIDRQILNELIDQQILLLEAERRGLRVSDDEVAERIMRIPALVENGTFVGERRYEQLLRMQNPPMTKAMFEAAYRQDMLGDKLRGALTGWMSVSDRDLEREFTQRNEKVKLQVVALNGAAFRDKVSVSDTDVTARFDAHKNEYRVGERRQISYLLLDREQIRQTLTPSPAEVDAFYNQNVQQYRTAEQVRASHILLKTEGKDEAVVRKQAEAILKQAKAPGADFATLAKKFSEDEGSKINGGDLDFFERGRMVAPFEEAAFAMQAGQISDLVKSPFGFHIIKVFDKRAATIHGLNEVRPQIQAQLALQKADQQIVERVKQLQTRLKTPADLTPAAKELGTTVQESGLFQASDPIPGLGAAPQVAAAAFRLADNEVSGPLNTSRGTVFITVSKKAGSYLPKLDDVKDRVRQDAIRARATEASRQRAGEIAATLKSAKDFAAAAKQLGLTAQTTDLIARGTPLPEVGASAEVDAVAFALATGAVSNPIATPDGSVIVRVVDRDNVTPEELAQARDTFRADLLNERQSRFFSAYMAKVREKMKARVTEHPEVYDRVVAAVQG